MLLACLLASAAPGSAAEAERGWEWRLTPLYIWAVNIRGNQTAGSGNPPVDTSSFSFDFEGAFSANFEGELNDRWGFYTDVIYTNLSNTRDNTKLDFKYLQAEADGYYRTRIGRQSVDWLIGLRYYRNQFELEPTTNGGKEDWVDPVVGARWSWSFAEKWTLGLRGDVGGFGVGSDLSWQGIAIVDWQPWRHASIVAGARVVNVDYNAGKGTDLFNYDIRMWGPVLGVSFKW